MDSQPPPKHAHSLCNFLLLPTLKSEGKALGLSKLQHMMATHHTEVSLHNFWNWNIGPYQLAETSQDLYLVASLTIPLTLPPCMALSQRRMV